MALMRCIECGNEVSDRAVQCPHCGYPVSEQIRITTRAEQEANERETRNELLLKSITERYPKSQKKKMIKELRLSRNLSKVEAEAIITEYLKNKTNLLNGTHTELQNAISKNRSANSVKAFAFFIGFLLLIAFASDKSRDNEPKSTASKSSVQQKTVKQNTEQSTNKPIQPTEEPTNHLANLGIPDKYIEDLTFAMIQTDMDINNIANVEKLDDWYNGERYKIYYNSGVMNEYNIYFYDTGKVASINNMVNEKLYECQEPLDNASDEQAIKLVYEQLGDYGQEDDFSGYKTIRHYLPNGKYSVTCETRGSGFYIQSIETHLENGYETPDIIEFIQFSDTSEEFTIEIKEGQCIFLLINSILQFKPME